MMPVDDPSPSVMEVSSLLHAGPSLSVGWGGVILSSFVRNEDLTPPLAMITLINRGYESVSTRTATRRVDVEYLVPCSGNAVSPGGQRKVPTLLA